MNGTLLVNKQLEEGKKLLEKLDASGTSIPVALWINLPDTENWRLLFAMKGIDRDGSRMAYTKIYKVIKENEIDLSLGDVSVIDTHNTLCRQLKHMIHTEPGISNIPFFGNYIHGQRFPDSVLYRVN
ncbi:hypothetical protein [Larkinella sp.]|uniref:hypothetical protein n=1 Tax=Larkinella sp. TaxID=2034517 RepID=UPI003BAD70D0